MHKRKNRADRTRYKKEAGALPVGIISIWSSRAALGRISLAGPAHHREEAALVVPAHVRYGIVVGDANPHLFPTVVSRTLCQ